jgi:competence protein CoiA
LERPFIQINRVADACWEREKIVFEVQCSPITEVEVEGRMRDYRSIGYDVVWLLDDKRYNKRVLRPAEGLLRSLGAYYICIQQGWSSECYDQFEVFAEGRRAKRGKRMKIDLQKIERTPKKNFNPDLFPKQIVQMNAPTYFHGSRMQRALQGHLLTMQYWRGLEIQLGIAKRRPNRFKIWVVRPYLALLNCLIRRM